MTSHNVVAERVQTKSTPSILPRYKTLVLGQVARLGYFELRVVRSEASTAILLEVLFLGHTIALEKIASYGSEACVRATLQSIDGQTALVVFSQAHPNQPQQYFMVLREDGKRACQFHVPQAITQVRHDQGGISLFLRSGDSLRFRF